MKIAFFHNLPSGGALKMLSQTANLFQKRGHEISLYSFSTAEHDFVPWISSGKQVIGELNFSGIKKYKRYLSASRKLAELINSSDADFVWVDKCRYLSTPTILQFLKKPHLFYAHEPLRNFENERLVSTGVSRKQTKRFDFNIPWIFNKICHTPDHFKIKAIDRANVLVASQMITNSKFTASWIQKVYGVMAEVCSPSVNTDFFVADSSTKKSNRVLSVGRLESFKGYDFLLDVLIAIPLSERPEWDIVCDSVDGDFLKKFQKKANQEGVEFKLHERISEDQLRKLYQSSMWTLCVSHNEPFGLVPLESMACGTPVIAMNEGGFKETVVDERTGYLLDRDIKTWAEKLSCVLPQNELALSFGANSVEHVKKNWDAKDWCDRLSQVTDIKF